MTEELQDKVDLDDSGEQEQNIKVYDNEAYMFGDDNSNDQSNPGEDLALQEHDLHSNNSEEEAKPYYHPEFNGDGEEEEHQVDTVRNKEEEESPHEGEIENHEENESNEEGEEGDSIPLITLKYISICQCCKNSFNSTVYIPYLFKCGHFFCKKCIDEQFTDDEGIKCPNDGLVALSISELKLLNNLITDKNVDLPSTR